MPEVTLFIISCGEESFEECLEAINKQTIYDKLKIEIIKDVYPMSRAFNAMHERCSTPYFIQVDADMILNKNACELLYNEALSTNFLTYVVYGQLYEEGFGIGGTVRCWKKSFFNYFKFRDVRTVDRDLFKRAKRFFLKRKKISYDDVIGIHKPRHSVFSEYLKAKSDVEKWRFLRRKVEKYALPLFDEIMKNPNLNKYKILGLLLGAITNKEIINKSKDISYEKDKSDRINNFLKINNFNELAVMNKMIDIDKIRTLFINSYSQNNHEKRLKLLHEIKDVFSEEKNINDNENIDDILNN